MSPFFFIDSYFRSQYFLRPLYFPPCVTVDLCFKNIPSVFTFQCYLVKDGRVQLRQLLENAAGMTLDGSS